MLPQKRAYAVALRLEIYILLLAPNDRKRPAERATKAALYCNYQ